MLWEFLICTADLNCQHLSHSRKKRAETLLWTYVTLFWSLQYSVGLQQKETVPFCKEHVSRPHIASREGADLQGFNTLIIYTAQKRTSDLEK